jgi:large subunit ribosomal protein L35
MPKIKSNRAAAKRFRGTGGGGVKRNKAYASHIMSTKSNKRKRNLRQGAMVDAANIKSIRKLLPYL